MINKSEEAEYPFPVDEVFKAAVSAVSSAKGMKVKKSDPVAHRIEVATGVSATSWGDRVVIVLSPLPGGRTRVSTASSPKTGAALGGWMSGGHQAKNVSQIFAAISAQFEQLKTYKNESDYRIDWTVMTAAGWQLVGNPEVNTKTKNVTARWMKPGKDPREEAAASDDIAASLRRLSELKSAGLITEDEFNAKGAALLERI